MIELAEAGSHPRRQHHYPTFNTQPNTFRHVYTCALSLCLLFVNTYITTLLFKENNQFKDERIQYRIYKKSRTYTYVDTQNKIQHI